MIALYPFAMALFVVGSAAAISALIGLVRE